MRTIRPALRILAGALAVLALVLGGPLHALHHHGSDAGQLSGPCAVCKSHSTAVFLPALPCAGVLLRPVGVLAIEASARSLATPAAALVPRAPPVFIA
jgi:hypothetical protein